MCSGHHHPEGKSDSETPVEDTGYTRNSRNWQGAFPKTPGRLLGLGLIRLYQLTLSGFIGQSCRHMPTCSEYGYEAVARYGLWNGGFMALFRFMHCGPGGTWGYDPVPRELTSRQRWWAPWRFWKQKTGE